ncbi:unnamed protein product, partial [Gulo gulo]
TKFKISTGPPSLPGSLPVSIKEGHQSLQSCRGRSDNNSTKRCCVLCLRWLLLSTVGGRYGHQCPLTRAPVNQTTCTRAPSKCKVSQLRGPNTCGAGGGGGSGGFGLMSAGHGLLQDRHAPVSPEPPTGHLG